MLVPPHNQDTFSRQIFRLAVVPGCETTRARDGLGREHGQRDVPEVGDMRAQGRVRWRIRRRLSTQESLRCAPAGERRARGEVSRGIMPTTSFASQRAQGDAMAPSLSAALNRKAPRVSLQAKLGPIYVLMLSPVLPQTLHASAAIHFAISHWCTSSSLQSYAVVCVRLPICSRVRFATMAEEKRQMESKARRLLRSDRYRGY